MHLVSPPVYCNEVDELIPFDNQQSALQWLQNNKLDTSGTPLLVPFKDENGQIQFLKPGIAKDNPENKAANNNFRIMGAANEVNPSFWDLVKGILTHHHVAHLNDVVGETISLVDHGFIVIYERGDKPSGEKFAKLFQKEEKDLFSQIKITSTNEGPRLNAAKFIQDLSQLSMDLEIRVGMSYFIIKDDSGKTNVYRHTFKQDPVNEKITRYLNKETAWHKSQHEKVENHKSENHHRSAFFTALFKWIFFAAITAVGAGLILGFFISGTIAPAIVAVSTFIGMASYGFYRADRNNPTTIEFGTPEFENGTEISFFSRLKQWWSHCFNKKLVETLSLTQKVISPTPPKIATVKSSKVLTGVNALIRSTLAPCFFKRVNEDVVSDGRLNHPTAQVRPMQ